MEESGFKIAFQNSLEIEVLQGCLQSSWNRNNILISLDQECPVMKDFHWCCAGMESHYKNLDVFHFTTDEILNPELDLRVRRSKFWSKL